MRPLAVLTRTRRSRRPRPDRACHPRPCGRAPPAPLFPRPGPAVREATRRGDQSTKAFLDDEGAGLGVRPFLHPGFLAKRPCAPAVHGERAADHHPVGRGVERTAGRGGQPPSRIQSVIRPIDGLCSRVVVAIWVSLSPTISLSTARRARSGRPVIAIGELAHLAAGLGQGSPARTAHGSRARGSGSRTARCRCRSNRNSRLPGVSAS